MWSGESALDLVVRTQPARAFSTGLRCLDAASSGARGFEPRDVVEIAGDPSAAPLSLVLLHVIAGDPSAAPLSLVLLHVVAAFLLRDRDDASDERVYLFDHECEATPALLFHLLVERLHDIESLSATARRAMNRVTLYQCRDALQWLATLNQLHYDLLDVAPTQSLVIINRVDSFQPIDKMVAKRVGDAAAMGDSLLLLLKQFVRYHSPFVFASKAIAAPRQGWETTETMPSSWTSQVTKRVVMRGRPALANGSVTQGLIETVEVRVVVDRQSRVRTVTVDGHRITEEEEVSDLETSMASTDASDVAPTLTAAELWGH
ncbi:hypothetical protein P43SY_000977 [Pythium insidiosum]|uniref:Uncharacterized protein n=1 Tax=Pythium insidiosum TaxID=114742 RepID=A0AAD5LG66_PYTIN|nr:hypothetical protein P43SY_000977 [Pythium insidiosum]